jgi:GT2 family glycosyltransferase
MAHSSGGMAGSKPIGVVIVNYNGHAYIHRCLLSVLRSTHAPAGVVVVDNASTDGSADQIVERFPGTVVLKNDANAGFAAGVNRGLRFCLDAGHHAVLVLNPDTEIEPETLEALVRGMTRHPGAILAPYIGMRDDPERNGSYVGSIEWWRGKMGSRYLHLRRSRQHQDERVNTASGCALLLPADAIRRLGDFDETYFLYFEDADYLEQGSRQGCEVWYVPTARIVHSEGSATGGPRSPLALYYYMRNRHHFVRKFQRGKPIYVAFLLYSIVEIPARAVGWMARKRPDLAWAACRGALHGWRGITGQDPRQTSTLPGDQEQFLARIDRNN